MKLSLDAPSRTHLVRAYSPGELRIGEVTYRSGLVVTATEVIEGWGPASAAALQAADFAPLIARRPEILLIGTGERQQFPEPAVLAALYEARIGFEVMDTRAACRTYNVLVAEGREVMAALML